MTSSLTSQPDSEPITNGCNTCTSSAKAYCPDPTLIASTNLNLSRMGVPARSCMIQKQDSFNSIGKLKRDSLANTLSHQPSKLDLIDDTTLTSLPLPPPLKPKARGSASGASSNTEKESVISLDRKQNFACIPLCNGEEADVDETFESEIFEDDEDDDDDHQDPIVLIEDYMARQKSPKNYNENQSCINNIKARISATNSDPSSPCITTNPEFNDNNDELTLINKKRSLATFKQRIFKNSLHLSKSINELGNDEIESISDVSTFTSTFNGDTLNNTLASNHSYHNSNTSVLATKPKNKRTISNDLVARPLLTYSKSENLEEIFGKIPGSDLLKHCELCEKPLYEISSIINNNKKFKKFKNNSPIEDSNKVNQVYNEFICGECVETYEEFFNELYQTEMNSSQKSLHGLINSSVLVTSDSTQNDSTLPGCDSSKNMKLLNIFQTIQKKYDKQNQIANVASKRSFYHKPATYKRINKAPFSENLINRLNYLNSIPEGYTYNNSQDQNTSGFGFGFGFKSNTTHSLQTGTPKKTIDLEWIKSLQSKLRWNWGFNGLVGKNSLESDG